MTEEILFFHRPRTRGVTIHWLLEELGAPYRIELLDFAKHDHKKPEYLAINPMGKVPAIVHRGVVVTEVGAICTYLADAFPAAKLAPPLDHPARGTYLRHMFFAAGCVDPAIADHMLERPPASRPGTLGYGTYEDTMSALEKALTPGPYLLGDAFSAVDVCVGAQIAFALQVGAIESRPAFDPYVALIRERPAFRRMQAQAPGLIAKLQG